MAAPAQAPPLDPCRLVPASDAHEVAGASLISEKEAPLGPTCIFKFRGGRADVTLAIERLSFSSVTRQMKHATKVSIRGFRAYCGTLGTQMLYVSLADSRVLNVTAPCPLAKALAVAALSRLHG